MLITVWENSEMLLQQADNHLPVKRGNLCMLVTVKGKELPRKEIVSKIGGKIPRTLTT